MSSIIPARISRFREQMVRENLDAFLVLTGENRRYLSGYTGEDTQFDESAGALIITQDALILATDSRFDLQARAEAPLYEVICYQRGLIKEIPGILKRLAARTLGIEGARMSYAQYGKLCRELEDQSLSVEIKDTPHLVETLRLVKDADEMAAIARAMEVAELHFEEFIHQLKPGMKETEAAWALEKRMREAGAQGLSFPVISAFGRNSALPHAIPGDNRIKTGEPLLFDWGARLDGYCSDSTRTIIMGKPDAQFEKIFTIVHDAQKKAIDAIRPGVGSLAIDAMARDHIAKKGFAEYFGHSLGHGVGLAVHEMPSISPMAEKEIMLQENMVFTVEPGIYLPDWGGVRLENMVRVTADGVAVFNRLPIDLKL